MVIKVGFKIHALRPNIYSILQTKQW